MKKMKLFSCIAFFLFLYTLSFPAYFYLSTEKSFMESEASRIKIESQATPSVNVRLYKIPNAEAFVKSKKNINRVYIESEYIKRNPAELLFKYINVFKASIKDYARERILEQDTKSRASEMYRDMLAPEYVKRNIVIGKIKEYGLVKEFQKTLDTGSSWTYSYIDFGSLKKGLYLAEVFSEESIAYTLVHVSEQAVLVKKSDTQFLIQAVDKQTGSGVKSEISVYDFESGKVVKSGKTAENGIFQFKFQKNKYSELLVYSKTKDDFTFYKVSLYPAAEIERLVYIYTDSPIYKYGHTVRIKGIIRDYKNSLFSLPETKKVKVSIIDPRESQMELSDAAVGEFGTFEAEYPIGDNYPTGIYKAVAVIDDKPYVGEFRVENYVKPQFKVSVIPEKKVVVGNKTIKARIKAEYFTGNRAGGAEVTYSIFKTPLRDDIFESEKDIFEDPAYSSKIEFLDSKSGTLDDKGEMEISFSPSSYNIDRDYAFIIKAQVTDESMARGSGSARIKVVQAEFFMKAEVSKSVYVQGDEVRVTVKLLYPDGTPVAKKSVSYEAVLEENSQVLGRDSVQTDNKGYASIQFKAGGKGFLKINLSTKDSFGNEVVENVYTWIGQEGGTFAYTSGDITIVFDKEEYRIGDKAKVLIVSPVSHAQALVSREREDIFDYSLQKFKGNTILMDVPVSRESTPNFYFTVLFVFNNEIYENTVKVKVPPADKILKLTVKTDKQVYSPREKGKITIEVRDKKGNPVEAELSVSVVNEALYQLSPEIFPDIRLFFYSYRWNSVTTLNSIALRFYGYSRMIKEKYALNYYKKKIWDFDDFMLNTGAVYTGAKDAEEQKKEEQERKLFKDQVLWEGRVKTDEKGKASVTVDFPDDMTEWRITANAVTKDTRVGKETASVRTFKELFVDLNMPENLSYQDKVKGFLKLFNNSPKEKKVSLKLAVDNGKSDFAPQQVTVPANKQKIVSFSYSAERVGKSRFTIEAKAEDKKDILVREVNVLPISLKKIVTDVKLIQKPDEALKFKVPGSALPGSIFISAGLSEMANPFGVAVESLRFLKMYPYGCVEQTTSSFLPNLIAFEVSKKLKVKLPFEFSDKDAIMEKGLKALYGFQNSDGGWGWWNEGKSDLYMTAYVLYAMNFVKKNYPEKLNQSVFEQGLRTLESIVRSGSFDENTQIYGYYVLSECGVYYKDMIDKLAKKENNSPYFLALLALAAKNSGLDDTALTIAGKLDNLASPKDLGVFWSSGGSYWYGADIIVTSAAVRALIHARPDSKNIEKGVIFLITSREGDRWRSTRETAEAVYALSEFVNNKAVERTGAEEVDVFLDSKKIDTLAFSGNNYRNTVMIPADALSKDAEHKLTFGVKGGYYAADVRVEYHTDDKNVEKDSSGLTLNRKYYKVINRSGKEELGNNPQVKVGDVVLVELETVPGKDMDYAVLEDGLPAGFVPVMQMNEYNLGIDFYKNTVHREFGKGKSSLFFKKMTNGKFYYLMQAVYPGSYYALPALGYEMYRPENRGNTVSSMMEVIE